MQRNYKCTHAHRIRMLLVVEIFVATWKVIVDSKAILGKLL